VLDKSNAVADSSVVKELIASMVVENAIGLVLKSNLHGSIIVTKSLMERMERELDVVHSIRDVTVDSVESQRKDAHGMDQLQNGTITRNALILKH